MSKTTLIITKPDGKKHPAVLFFNTHKGLYVSTIVGEEMTLIDTVLNKSFEEHLIAVQNLLDKLGRHSDYCIVEDDNDVKILIEKLKNKL